MFELVAPYEPSGDQPEAIARLTRNLTEDGQREFTNWETLPINTYTTPRSYSIGVRMKF